VYLFSEKNSLHGTLQAIFLKNLNIFYCVKDNKLLDINIKKRNIMTNNLLRFRNMVPERENMPKVLKSAYELVDVLSNHTEMLNARILSPKIGSLIDDQVLLNFR
jgi:hypothetical protein